jgi:uncharacterized protein YxjI
MQLTGHRALYIRQRREIAELFGFETRNKYEVTDEGGRLIGYAAEQQKGILGFLLRSFLGHWRRFDIHVWDPERRLVINAHHPFRFLFQRLEVTDAGGQYLGAVQQRFAILSKRFDVEGPRGETIMTVSSPIWKIWTFPFSRGGVQAALVEKKWSGLLKEAFTDSDNFRVSYEPAVNLGENERRLVLAAALFIDLQYFEAKANR